MAFRSQAAALCLILLGVTAQAEDVRIRVRHPHLRGEGRGVLTAAETGLSFREEGKKAGEHQWTWAWTDVQQLWVGKDRVKVLTYQDQRWKLGADREFTFTVQAGERLAVLAAAAREALGQRLVAAFEEQPGEVLWQVPVKRQRALGGSEGVLVVARDRILYRSPEKGESRTWLLSDLDNVSSSGPFDLTVTTFERSKRDYGSRAQFSFQLKQPLEPARYEALWRRLHQGKQMEFLQSAREGRQK